jgi:hypothetical protein
MTVRRPVVLAVIGAIVVAGGVTALLLVPGGSNKPAGGSSRVLGRNAQELVDLLLKSRGLAYHARYTTAGDTQSLGGALNVELWRKGSLVRQDLELKVEDESVRAAAIQRRDGVYACRRVGVKPWECTASPGSVPQLDKMLDQLSQDLADSTVTVRDDTISGRKVRCFTATASGGPRDFCATSDGVPVLIAAGGARLELVSLDHNVPDSVFVLPGGTASPSPSSS